MKINFLIILSCFSATLFAQEVAGLKNPQEVTLVARRDMQREYTSPNIYFQKNLIKKQFSELDPSLGYCEIKNLSRDAKTLVFNFKANQSFILKKDMFPNWEEVISFRVYKDGVFGLSNTSFHNFSCYLRNEAGYVQINDHFLVSHIGKYFLFLL